MAKTLVYDPTAPFIEQAPEQALRETGLKLKSLSGKVVGFIDNSKPNFSNLIDAISQNLIERYGVKEVIRKRKPMASIPATAADMRDLVARCDLVITGSGD
jgi:hypothetical protein